MAKNNLKMRWITGFVFCGMLATASLAVGQEVAPVPHPRISRDNAQSQELPQNAPLELNGQALVIPTPTPSDPAQLPAISFEQPVTLSAKIVENGPTIPDGLVWRVFDTQTDATGQLALLFKSEDAAASLSLPQGEYLVHVAFGRSQASDTLLVEAGPNIKTIVLEAGALKLRSVITGDIDIPASQLRFDIFTTGLDEGRVPVALDVEQDALIHLNAGTYNVVSKWGKINATVRADLRVEPSQVTEATLFHRAAQVTFKLASSAGGEAIADVDWTVKEQSGITLFSALGAFPVVILAEGEYVIIAQSGERIFNRDFQVLPGRPREIEVLTTVY